ncbi:hypothetical protein L1049_004081 [Liquidambar formosana]|uniref:Uncharacterized protein n=1 Tax=Liquidambar formosana TaxID=63359 RepID=A0AAP0WY23_LIQFO
MIRHLGFFEQGEVCRNKFQAVTPGISGELYLTRTREQIVRTKNLRRVYEVVAGSKPNPNSGLEILGQRG